MTKRKNNPYNKIGDMVEKIAEHDKQPCQKEHCSICMKGSVREWEKEFVFEVKKIEKIGKDPKKSAVEKKMEIFDILLEMDFGKLSTSENERANILLKSHFHGELAKKYLKEYKEATAKEFSNN